MSAAAKETSQQQQQPQGPKITKDPRFRAARKLIETGRDGAIDMFGMLLEEARTKYGEASIETAPAYFEYGMALFRESQRQQQRDEAAASDDAEDEEGEEEEQQEEEVKKPAAVEEVENGSKEKSEDIPDEEKKQQQTEEEADNEEEADEGEEQAHDEEEGDLELAFSMMETAFAVYDNYVQLAKLSSSGESSSAYLQFAEREQLPRILSNIGDLLSVMGRHADAADAYTRELLYRDANLTIYENKKMSLEELVDRRKGVEANVLVATELLECEPGQDVITTETKSCLVKASEREEYATGYYEQARDQLQETVYLMAKLIAAAKDDKTKADLNKEKENVCFASTLVMGVGEQLALVKEKQNSNNGEKKEEDKLEPVKKKKKL